MHEATPSIFIKMILELQNDMSIDACIKKVTYCHIIYGKTVETANEIANLCLAYQDKGQTILTIWDDHTNIDFSLF